MVFPTTVGMNRLSARNLMILKGVPHDRGDEPDIESKEGSS